MKEFDDPLDLLSDDDDGVIEMSIFRRKKSTYQAGAAVRAVALLSSCCLVHRC
jgi:hypothetical protein